jgi:hypothetical protein
MSFLLKSLQRYVNPAENKEGGLKFLQIHRPAKKPSLR